MEELVGHSPQEETINEATCLSPIQLALSCLNVLVGGWVGGEEGKEGEHGGSFVGSIELLPVGSPCSVHCGILNHFFLGFHTLDARTTWITSRNIQMSPQTWLRLFWMRGSPSSQVETTDSG